MEKVWMRGVPGRGTEVKNLFKEWGGRSSKFDVTPMSACDPKNIIYINHEGFIDYADESKELAKVIMDCYKPIGLPAIAVTAPLWENGTVLIRKDTVPKCFDDGPSDFVIVDATKDEVPFFTAYAELTPDNLLFDYSHLPFEGYRRAKPEEIKEFVSRLRDLGKFWNPWTKKMENL